jgi:hypothetical protein
VARAAKAVTADPAGKATARKAADRVAKAATATATVPVTKDPASPASKTKRTREANLTFSKQR